MVRSTAAISSAHARGLGYAQVVLDTLSRLEAACRLGAFVAGRPGATPEHEVATIASLSPCAWGVDECVLEL